MRAVQCLLSARSESFDYNMKELQHEEAQLFFGGKSVGAVDTSGPNRLRMVHSHALLS